MNNIQSILEDFNTNGYAIITNFLNEEEVESLKKECHHIIDKMKVNEERAIFTNGKSQKSDDYFMTSGDKIRYFYESEAFDKNGELVVDKYKSLNKIGHALHWLNPTFKNITFSDKVKNLVKNVGFIDPVVVQSMYIFKNPGIGGEVIPHQDATYLHSWPDLKLIGLWFALEDATTENGCLSFIPGSHKDGLHTQWIRNAESSPSMVLTNANNKFDEKSFVFTPVSKGSCILIDGLVVHKSEANRSKNPRPIYTFHIFDQNNRKWDALNWLQPTQQLPFPSLYNN